MTEGELTAWLRLLARHVKAAGADYPLNEVSGWPGAFLTQRRLRHKCSKGSYQVVFWLIGLAYQFARFDSFHDWQFARPALNRFIGPPASHPKAC
ncbi:MAG: hypothetical protein WCR20_06915 [Verrucomicrobiota bacterium]